MLWTCAVSCKRVQQNSWNHFSKTSNLTRWQEIRYNTKVRTFSTAFMYVYPIMYQITCVVVVFYNGFSLGNYGSFSKSPLNIWMITTLMRIPFSQLYLKLLKNFVKSKFKMLHIFSEIKIYPIRTPITSLCSRSTISFVIRHLHS